MNEEEKTIPLSTVELMVDLQYVNLTNSTKMIAQSDLRDVRIKLKTTDKLVEARTLLITHITNVGKIEVRHVLVEDATSLITGAINELRDRLESEEQRLVKQIDSLDREIEEYNKKKEERKKRRENDDNIQDTPL